MQSYLSRMDNAVRRAHPEMIERLPSQNRKAFNYEAQIAKLEEEIERYQKLKLRLYEDQMCIRDRSKTVPVRPLST